MTNHPMTNSLYLGQSSVNLSSDLKGFLISHSSGGFDDSILLAKPFVPPLGMGGLVGAKGKAELP
jgi:hypothetical protein